MLKMIATSILLIVVGAVLLHAQPPTPNGWEDAAAIYTIEPVVQTTPSITSNQNWVHTLCLNETFELMHRRSSDHGFSWAPEIQRISDVGAEVLDGYQIVADSRGYVYAVWYEGGTNNCSLLFAYSTDNGDQWSDPRVINTELNLTYPVYYPPKLSLTVDTEDTVRLAFIYSYFYDDAYACFLCYSQYYDDGSPAPEWTPHERISDLNGTPCQSWSHSICALENVPHVAFATFESVEGPCYVYHGRRNSVGNWSTNRISDVPYSNVPRIVLNKDETSYLHVVIHEDIRHGANYIYYYRSTDSGSSWPVYHQLFDTDYWYRPTMAINGSKIFVAATFGAAGDLQNQVSTNSGLTWQIPITLATGSTDAWLTSNAFGYYLIFREICAPTVDFTAFYDTLFSSTDMATAANAGRHLYRVPEKNLFNLVYESKGKVRYTRTEGNYVDWQPFHKVDDGCYPSVGYVYVPFGPIQPESAACIAYKSGPDEIRYRCLYEPTGGWFGFSILEPGSGLIPGAPSLITVGYNICVVYPVYNPDRLPQYPFFSAIYFNEFRWDAPVPGAPVVLAQSDFLLLNSPVITYDGNYDLHVVWDVDGEIWYRMRDYLGWQPQEKVDNTEPPSPSATPFVETYGDRVFCDWTEYPLGISTEVYENFRYIWWPGWQNPADPGLISNSPLYASDFPVSCLGDFSVWAEQNPMLFDYDTRYLSKTWGYGWVNETPPRSYYPHAQLWPCDPTGYWHLYTASTEGNTMPYKVATRENLFPGGKGGLKVPVYYKVVTGEPVRSRFCTKRDSTIRYGGFNSDYGKNELVYTLDFLDPLYSSYDARLVIYFEGTGTRTEKVVVDSVDFGSYELHPNRPETLSITIPRSLYWKDHKVVVTLKGMPVTKAGIIVHQLEKQTSGKRGLSGVQTQQTVPTSGLSQLKVSPNPVRTKMTLTLIAHEPASISIGLSDITGRLVKTVFVGKTTAGRNVFTVDTKGLSNGVYFLTFKSGKETSTRKVVLVR